MVFIRVFYIEIGGKLWNIIISLAKMIKTAALVRSNWSQQAEENKPMPISCIQQASRFGQHSQAAAWGEPSSTTLASGKSQRKEVFPSDLEFLINISMLEEIIERMGYCNTNTPHRDPTLLIILPFFCDLSPYKYFLLVQFNHLKIHYRDHDP